LTFLQSELIELIFRLNLQNKAIVELFISSFDLFSFDEIQY